MAIWFLVLWIQAQSPLDGQAWQWPIDTTFGVSATFGEFRGDHFHMGIDFSTNGREGMVIRPAKPGVVQKVRAQDHGYGRVVYVTHADGFVSVYAHLAGFGEKIERALSQRHLDPKDSFGTARLAVALSDQDILGYSGESGAGLPHFHFEVRDSKNAPIDPLSLAFPRLPVDPRLRFEGIRLLPLTDDARINHGRVPVFLPADQTACQAQGTLGIEVVAYLETSRGNRLGVSGLRIRCEQDRLGQWIAQRIPYTHYKRAGSVFDQARSGFSPTRYVYWLDPRFDLPDVAGWTSSKSLEVSEPTRLTIDIRDFQGAWQSTPFELDPNASHLPLDDLGTRPAVVPTTLELIPWRGGIRVRGTIQGTLVRPDQMIGLAPGQDFFFEMGADPAPEDWIWRTTAGSVKRTLGRLPDAGPFSFVLGDFRLEYTEQSALPGPQVALLLPPDAKMMSHVLDYISPVLQFGLDGVPVAGLELRYPVSAPHAGVYAWSYAKGRWVHWGDKTKDDPNWVSVDLDYLTPLVVARDLVPPTIQSRTTHTFFEGTRTVIPLRDQGSGIDPELIAVQAMGQNVAFSYDADRHWIVLDEKPSDKLQVTVSDRAGWTTSRAR